MQTIYRFSLLTNHVPGSSHCFACSSHVMFPFSRSFLFFLLCFVFNIQGDDFYHRHTLMSHSCRCNVLSFSLLHSSFFFAFFFRSIPSLCVGVCVCACYVSYFSHLFISILFQVVVKSLITVIFRRENFQRLNYVHAI